MDLLKWYFVCAVMITAELDLETHFECATEESSDRIRLYLGLYNLKISCYLKVSNSFEQQKRLSTLYSTAGLAPSLAVYDRTESAVYNFQMSLLPNQSTWSIDIPRNNITLNRDVAPVDEWYVQFSMRHGFIIFSTEGTLLDTLREPLLQWSIGEQISARVVTAMINNVVDLRVSKNPCANDVAVLAPVFAPGTSSGIILTVTKSGFSSTNDHWFNCTETLCEILKGDCSGLATIDVKLTSYHLLILTTRGLFISQDLTIREKGSLNASQCFYSQDPFSQWYSCRVSNETSNTHVAFLVDREQHTGIVLSFTPARGAVVSVFSMSGPEMKNVTKFPPVSMSFIPRGMFSPPYNHQLYLYGSEVWSSADGGSSFTRIISLEGEAVVKAFNYNHDQAIVFVTNLGSVYLSKADMGRYTQLNQTGYNISSLYCDHLGSSALLSLNAQKPNGLNVDHIETDSLIKDDDLAFDRPLSLQFTSDETVLFHEHLPLHNASLTPQAGLFSSSHINKVIKLSAGGSGLITQVYQIRIARGFVAVAKANILESFQGDSLTTEPIQQYTLTVTNESYITLRLEGNGSHGFQDTHIGKTVVIPGSSSYLIMEVLGGRTALADPTMPTLTAVNQSYGAGKWLLFNSGGRGRWQMREIECRHTLQSLDGLRSNSLVYINVRETRRFGFRASMSDSCTSVFRKKLMKVTLGNPSLLKVTTTHRWDILNNHILEITVFSFFVQKGLTTVTVTIPEASLACTSAVFSFTLQSSCPPGLCLRYIPDNAISPQDWLHGKPVDAMGNRRLMDLPVNYRPPSQLGVDIPISDNIYNADPSQPHPREFSEISEDRGRYKQCAGKSSSAECGCTDDLRLSPFAAHSDCRKRVLRLIYPVNNLSLTLYITRPGYENMPLKAPMFITVTEVNSRTNWKVTGSDAVPSMLKIQEYLWSSLITTLYNPEGLLISCNGTELFHFRITVIPGMMLCDLVEEIQIYVDDPPLLFPVDSTAATVLAGLLLAGFLMMHSKIRFPSRESIEAKLRRHRSMFKRGRVVPRL
ncbi:cation channel sperm-associated auxiliary subunit beta [Amia ocellicauda]|uniref:cation channel sperm-associated auxiliary subunit beta n=1 Tax=Amia ocellicauda TaxID=2972642 RepID=UPI0034648DC2